MPEYQKIRTKYSLFEICQEADLITEVSLQPVHALGVDAAILFADILLPVAAMGLEITFAKGAGPVIHEPLRAEGDIDRLQALDVDESLSAVMTAIRQLRHELPEAVALIGFAGAPFTLASYLIEGGSSRHYATTKGMMRSRPDLWRRLMDLLTQVTIDYLLGQIRAGAQVVQLFDSWVGNLSPEDYERYVMPYSARVFNALSGAGVPSVHFGTGTATLLPLMARAGGDIIGLDWRINLAQAWKRLGDQVGVQGNLDPTILLAPREVIHDEVERILQLAGGRPGHIFNLGHGVLPETPVENARAVVEQVQARELKEPA